MIKFFSFIIRFYGGWRRKVGILTLMLAFAFMAGWIRGYEVCDILRLHRTNTETSNVIISRDGFMFEAYRYEPDGIGASSPRWMSYPVKTSGRVFPFDDERWLSQNAIDWRYACLGFECGQWHTTSPTIAWRISFWTIPYWSVVLTLTLFSGWLLLSKPRAETGPTHVRDGSGDLGFGDAAAQT